MINWRVRIRNKQFWLALVPALLLLVTQVCAIFGVTIDTSIIGEQLTAVISTVFLILTIIGVVTDPTTEGVSDSVLAMTYKVPKPKGE